MVKWKSWHGSLDLMSFRAFPNFPWFNLRNVFWVSDQFFLQVGIRKQVEVIPPIPSRNCKGYQNRQHMWKNGPIPICPNLNLFGHKMHDLDGQHFPFLKLQFLGVGANQWWVGVATQQLWEISLTAYLDMNNHWWIASQIPGIQMVQFPTVENHISPGPASAGTSTASTTSTTSPGSCKAGLPGRVEVTGGSGRRKPRCKVQSTRTRTWPKTYKD